MGDGRQTSSSWVYPDRDAWEKLLHLQATAFGVSATPAWWSRESRPGPADQVGHRNLGAIRNQLAWARKCFQYAQSVLPDSEAKTKAHRLAEELARARTAFDSPQKADGCAQAARELAGVGQYDPARYPKAFVEVAGACIASAGRILSGSPCATIAYWGRVLARAGGFFRAMKHDLSSG